MSDTAPAQPIYPDVRSLVLGGNVKAKRQAIYVERLGGWLNIQELYGDERAAVLQASIDQKTGRANIGVLYAGLDVYSLRYPHPDFAPAKPVPPVEPGPEATTDELKAYQEALAQYDLDVKWYPLYPGLVDTELGINNPPHPHAGERIFNPKDRDAFNTTCPGQIIEEIAKPAFLLSGFRKEDIDEKKASLSRTVVDGTITPSPSDSTGTTSSNS
jgi:hypothetical protein